MLTPVRKQEIIDSVMLANGRDFQVGDLIEAARDPNHDAHGFFEWDDDKCGDAWRQRQEDHFTSRLRRVVTITPVERTQSSPVDMKLVGPREDPQAVTIPAWVADGKRKRVRGETLEGQALLQQESVKRMKEYRERYRALLLVAGVDQMAAFIEKSLSELKAPEA